MEDQSGYAPQSITKKESFNAPFVNPQEQAPVKSDINPQGNFDTSGMISAEKLKQSINMPEADILANQRKERDEFVKPEAVKKADAKIQEVDSQIVDVSRNLNAVRESQKVNIQALNDLKSKIDDPNTTAENKQQLIDIYNQTLVSAQETEASEKQIFSKATALQRSKSTLKKVYDVQQNLDMNSNDDIVKGAGNFLSHVYNATIPSIVGGAGALLESAGDVGAMGPSSVAMEQMFGAGAGDRKVTDILGDGLQAAGKDMSTEIDQKYSDKHYITSMAGDIVGSIVSTALPAGALGKAGKAAQLLSGVTAGTMQMADGVHKKAKEAGLSDADAGAMTLAIAPVSGLLEMWGASNIVDNIVGRKLINELISESTKKLAGQQITKQLIFETVGDTFKTLGQKYGKNLLVSAGEEGLTEGLQGEVEAAAENIYDVTQDKPAYGTEFFSTKTQLDIAKQAAIGALAGGPMGVLSGVSTPKSIYDKAIELKSEPDKFAEFQERLQGEVEAENITPEQADNIIKNMEAMITADQKVPAIVTDKNKRFEAVELIKEKNEILSEVGKLDVAMATPMMDRVNEINSTLELIARGVERTNLKRKPLNKNTDAVQEQSPDGVLQREQGATRETGSERGGVEQVIEGTKAAKEAEIQKTQEEITALTKKKEDGSATNEELSRLDILEKKSLSLQNENIQQENQSRPATAESIQQAEKEKGEVDQGAVADSERNAQGRTQAKESLTKLRDDGLLVTADKSLLGKAKKLAGMKQKTAPMSDAEIDAQISLLDAMSNVWKKSTGKDNFYETFIGDIKKGDLNALKQMGGALLQESETSSAPKSKVTLGVFSDAAFSKMAGQAVNPQSISDLMKGRGKQIEKEIIAEVLNYDKYKGQKRISFDEFRNDVDMQVMKLEKIKSSSYATYGEDNLGDNENYGDAETVIFNAPVEHGETGHFSSDFTTEGLDSREWELKQLGGTDTWAAVDKAMPAGVGEAELAGYVGTAGTKADVKKWIKDRSKKKTGDINKGLFGHIRTWFNKNTGVFTVAELQSDYFQKNKATDLLVDKIPENEIAVHLNKNVFLPFDQKIANEVAEKMGITTKVVGENILSFDKDGNGVLEQKIDEPYEGVPRGERERVNIIISTLNHLGSPSAEALYNEVKADYHTKRNLLEKTEKQKYISKRVEEMQKAKPAPLVLRQFAASQKIHEIRLFKEAIQHAAESGAKVMRFPSPHTLAVIEGYVNRAGASGAPYEITSGNSDRLNAGDEIDFEGDSYTVLDSDSSTITVAPSDKVYTVRTQELYDDMANNDYDDIHYTMRKAVGDMNAITREEVEALDEDDWSTDRAKRLLQEYFDENPDEETVKFYQIESDLMDLLHESASDMSIRDMVGASEVFGDGDYVYYTDSDTQELNQPDGYDEGGVEEADFEDDLSSTQQTVVDKYKELNAAMKKMRPDTKEIVDENGMKWLETEITDADRTAPIVAFQKEGAKVKGAVAFSEDSKATVHIFDGADISTLAHEITGHIGRRVLEKMAENSPTFKKDYEAVKKWAGVKGDKWTTKAEEKFARGFERYLREGKAPTKALESVFSKMRDWLTAVYKTIKGSSIDVELTPEIRKVFDNLLDDTKVPEQVAISRAEREKQRERLGLPPLPPIDKNIEEHTWKKLNEEANRLVDSGEVDYNILAQSIIDGQTESTDLTKAILLRGATELENKILETEGNVKKAKANGDLAAAEKAGDEWMEAIAQLDVINLASEEGLTKAGRALAAGKMSMNNDFSIGNLYTEFRKANKGEKIPKELMERLNEQAAKIQEMDARIKAAEEIIEEFKKGGKNNIVEETTKEKIKKVREKRSKLFDDWKKYRDGSDAPVKNSPLPIGDKDIVFLRKVIASYIEEGILTTAEMASKLRTDVKKALGIKITEEQIDSILNEEVDGKKLVDDFTNNGLVGNIEKTKERVVLLKDKLKDPDKYIKALNDLKEAREKKEQFKSPELKSLEAEVRGLATELRVEREKQKKKIVNEKRAIEFANRSKSEKIKEGIANVLNVPRSLMASFDFSAPLRQGLVATIAHPTSGAKATVEMFKQVFSQKNFDEWLIKYKLSPDWELAKKSELYVADPSEFTLNGKEEAFMSNLAERIPIVGRFIKGSERAYVGYLNKLRTDVFKNGAELLMKDGKTFEKNEKEFKALADFINSSTGRGKLPNKTIEDAAPLLNAMFFSPRLIASRVNLLNPVYYAKMPKSVAMMAVKDMAKFAGFASSVLLMFAAAGADVEKDPRSSDFAKIKVGNTRYDILGGFQQYIKLAAITAPEMFGGGKKKTEKGFIDLTKPNWQQQTRGSELLKFARQKLSPSVGMAVDFLTGTKTTGEKAKFNEVLSWDNEWVEHLTPLQLQSGMEAYKAGGWGKVFSTMIPSMFGIGVQTYSNAKKNKELEKAFKEFRRMPKD